MDVPGVLTNASDTIVLSNSAGSVGPNQALFGGCNPVMGITAQVLSNGIFFSLHDQNCNPSWSKF